MTHALVSPRHRRLPLQEVRDQDGWRADGPAPCSITVQGTQVIHAHQSCDAVLATGLPSLPQVQTDATGALDALTRRERRTDQTKQPGILSGPVRDRVREPLVVPARATPSTRHSAGTTLFVSIGFDELVRRSDPPRAQLRGHRHRPPCVPGCYATIDEILGTQARDPITYAANGIDLLTVEQKNGAGYDLLETRTYNSQHEPLTITDASGQTRLTRITLPVRSRRSPTQRTRRRRKLTTRPNS